MSKYVQLAHVVLVKSEFERKQVLANIGPSTNNIASIKPYRMDSKEPSVINIGMDVEAHQPSEVDFDVRVFVRMVGIFKLNQVPDSEPSFDEDFFYDVLGPTALFPFIREHIVSLSLKAAIHPINLPLVDFEELSKTPEGTYNID